MSGANSPKTVLIVEDEPALRGAVARILTANHFKVLTARNGAAAVALAKQNPGRIDVLLVDVVMPGINGVETALQVCRLHPESQVIFVSAHMDDPQIRRSVAQASNFLPKPFSPAQLLHAIEELQAEPDSAAQ
jgi:two-component system cell cycle sensor histidine kinase/response regulator CckA